MCCNEFVNGTFPPEAEHSKHAPVPEEVLVNDFQISNAKLFLPFLAFSEFLQSLSDYMAV